MTVHEGKEKKKQGDVLYMAAVLNEESLSKMATPELRPGWPEGALHEKQLTENFMDFSEFWFYYRCNWKSVQNPLQRGGETWHFEKSTLAAIWMLRLSE